MRTRITVKQVDCIRQDDGSYVVETDGVDWSLLEFSPTVSYLGTVLLARVERVTDGGGGGDDGR